MQNVTQVFNFEVLKIIYDPHQGLKSCFSLFTFHNYLK